MRVLWMMAIVVASAAQADDAIDVRMRPSATSVAVGERFSLDVVVVVSGHEQIDDITMPDLSGFEIDREHESQGVNMSVVKGRRTVTVTHTTSFVLHATTPGKKIIAGAAASLGSSQAKAAAVAIMVTGTAAMPTAPAAGTALQQPSDAPVDPNLPPQAGKETMFLHTRVEPTSPVVGEQIAIITELWSTRRLTSLPQKISHKPPGFYCVPDDDRTRRMVTVGNTRYEAAVIARDALFGLAPGAQTVAPLSLQVDLGGFGQRNKNLTSNSVTIDVLPLPPDAAGAVVGDYGWESMILIDGVPSNAVNMALKVGEPFVLRTVVKGRGNIDNLEIPAAVIEGARVFPAQQQRTRDNIAGVLSGVLLQDQLVTPTAAGTLTIPAMTLRTYVPAERAVRVLRSDVKALRVVGANKSATSKDASLLASVAVPWDRQQRGAELLLALRHGWYLQGVAVLLLVVGLWPRRRTHIEVVDLAKQVRAAAGAGDAAAVLTLVHEAFATVGTVSAGLSAAELEQRFHDVPMAKRVAAFVRAVESARYAPGNANAGLGEGVAIVDQLIQQAKR